MKWDEVTAILVRARARIADRERWCRGAFAWNARCSVVYEWSPDAVRWCAVGAVKAEAMALTVADEPYRPSTYQRRVHAAVERLASALPRRRGATRPAIGATGASDRGAVMTFNDRRPHADVLALFDEAIRRK